MTGDIYLGRLFGIPFRLHWSWFLAVFLIAWTLSAGFFPQTLSEYAGDPATYWLLGITAALGLFVSVVLHELGHAFVARRCRVSVRGIRLFVFGGVAELGRDARKPSHEILIALGGPAVSLVLVLVCHGILSLIISGGAVEWDIVDGILTLRGGTLLSAGAAALFFYLGMINTVVLLFNLIPAFPLDGGRVLRGVIWAFSRDYLLSTRIAGAVGIVFAWLLFLSGFLLAFRGNLLGGVWLFFLGTFLQNAAQSSIAYAQLQQILRGVHVADMMRKDPVTVEAHQNLRNVVEQFFLRYPYKAYPVVEEGRFIGMLTLRAVQDVDRKEWDTISAGELSAQHGPTPTVDPRLPVLQALRRLSEAGQSRLPVVDDGVLVGLLCGRDVMHLIENRAGLVPRDGDDGPDERHPRSAASAGLRSGGPSAMRSI